MYGAIISSVQDRYGALSASESLASSAVKTAIDIRAAIIVVLSETGTTARYISKFRPGRAVVALTPSATVARQMAGILNGVHAYIVDDLSDDIALSRAVGSEAIRAGVAGAGDLMVIVSGTTYGKGKNNQIRVEKIAAASESSRKLLAHLRSFEYAETS